MLSLNKIHHVAIICSDYEKSKDFYTRILGLKIIRENYREERKSYKLDLAVGEHAEIELFSFEHPPERPTEPEARGLRHLAFEVENLEESIKKLEEEGVEVEPVRFDPHTGQRFVFFFDPDQLPLELYERVSKQAL